MAGIPNGRPKPGGKQLTRTEVRAETHTMRSGPLPDPEELARYNQVMPDAAERIMIMAEKQQVHMHKRSTNDQMIVVFSSITGLLLGAGALGLAFYMASMALPGISSVIWAFGCVISVVLGGKFYLQNKRQNAKNGS